MCCSIPSPQMKQRTAWFSRFAQEQLSLLEAEQRVDVLYRVIRKRQEGQILCIPDLIEFDTRELTELEEALYGELTLDTHVTIKRNFPGQSYTVKFTDTREEIAFKQLRSARKIILNIQRRIKSSGQEGTYAAFIAQSKLTKSAQRQQTMVEHRFHPVLGIDFFDTALHWYKTGQELLSIAKKLGRCPPVYKNLLKFYMNTCCLYELETLFNKASQLNMLKHAENTQHSALATCDLFKKHKSKIKILPPDFAQAYQPIVEHQKRQTIELEEETSPLSDEVLALLTLLKQQADDCTKLINQHRLALDDEGPLISPLAAANMVLQGFRTLLVKKHSGFKRHIEIAQDTLKWGTEVGLTPFDAIRALSEYKDNALTLHARCLQMERQCFVINQLFCFSIHQLLATYPHLQPSVDQQISERRSAKQSLVDQQMKTVVAATLHDPSLWSPSMPTLQALQGWGPRVFSYKGSPK